ncbi:MAG: hypothetical protein ACXW2X_10275, partial [Thermoanaerobaculia bacterium]
MQIFVNPNYNFVRWRLLWIAVSVLFIIAGAGIYFTRGIEMGIDFSGGANIILKFRESVPLAALRSDLPGATIQQYGKTEERSVLIRLPQLHREGDYAGTVVAGLFRKLNPEGATRHDLNYYGTDRLAALLKENDPEKKGTGVDAQKYYNSVAERIIAKRSELGIFTSMSQVTSNVSPAIASLIADKAYL